jgi:DNA-binding response OmpR family regulator
LAADGYRVTTLFQSTAVETELALRPHDMLLMRIEMPDLDGVTVLSRLRERGIDIPAMLLTQQASLHETIQALNAGADDVIRMPVPHGELVARIQALLRRSGYFDRSSRSVGNVRSPSFSSLDRLIMQLNERLRGSGATISEVSNGYVVIADDPAST